MTGARRASTTEARQRSAQTKRERSRRLLLDSAAAVFSEQGWHGARMEDIAKAAGVSVPTAYNHFPGGKQQLIAAVYRPLLDPVIEQAEADREAGLTPKEAVIRHIRALAGVTRRHQALTATLMVAVSDQTARVGPPTSPDDVRKLVPATTSLNRLIEWGQDEGEFVDEIPAADIGAYHCNGLFLRVLTRPQESAQETSQLVLSQLLPALIHSTSQQQH
ncbi:TetR/AcrR family transcriptional regulator [Streptomyces sp. NPDC047072]|uniref:TetR/AcrR family transcriptional regulator n=1 Tax=Streptomyces sp. NPDC047072 TaxID=3154809 RepID=UPI0033C5D448